MITIGEAAGDQLQQLKKELEARPPEPADPEPVKATVKFINKKHGFGFATAENGTEFFIHKRHFSKREQQKIDEGTKIAATTEQAPGYKDKTAVKAWIDE